MLSWPDTYCNVNGSVYSPASVRKLCRSAWRPASGWVLIFLPAALHIVAWGDLSKKSPPRPVGGQPQYRFVHFWCCVPWYPVCDSLLLTIRCGDPASVPLPPTGGSLI